MSDDGDDPDAFLAKATALARQALSEWDLDVVNLTPLKVRENAVFRVDLADGGRRALRIHRRGYHTDAALTSEFAWMRALGEAGIDVPIVVPSRHGRPFECLEGGGLAGARQIDVFEWIGGRQLGESGGSLAASAADIAAQYHTIGATMARMHNQAERWPRPPGFVRHAWDTDGLVGDDPLWGRFWELDCLTGDQRTLMQRTRHAVREALDGFGRAPDRYGLIHADLVPENVLVDGGDVRVIDFDDAGFGWHLFDIATSLYFITPDPHYATARDALVDGYRSVRELPATSLDLLPYFLAARSTTYLGWVHTRRGTQTAIELTPFLVELACATVSRLP